VSRVGAALALTRTQRVEQSVSVQLGSLRVTAYTGGSFDVYGAGRWTAHVHGPEGIVARATADDEHMAIAVVLAKAAELADEIREAIDAWRARAPEQP
jgi:fermentation-respiration switch protein FrsA (DUF1100 family)